MKIKSKIIQKFIEDLPPKYKKPLDNVITKMLELSKYIDSSTLIYDENNECKFDKEHYHNWDCNPTKIEKIKNFENKEYNENNDIELTKILGNDKSNIECVKGDVQLGKRVHTCILMWISIYIYDRPVLYLVRPLNIDKEQFQDDIDGTEPWNFNIEWIKNQFNEGMSNEINNKKYFEYKLPSSSEIKDKKVANKLSDREYISDPKKIYIALMNPTDLETLNRKFYEYILKYCQKVNITLVIDESDLLCPTAENSNNISVKDIKNSKSERLLSRLVNKVAHTIHITGTAHSFFWNYTTALNEDEKTVIPVEKIFVMNRHKDYYGFMKKNINFSTNNEDLPIISEWWSKGKGARKDNKYDIIKDYNLNIKHIISSIVKRHNPYNSFLISEEKIQNNQIKIAEKIIKDFRSVFCVVFHGRQGNSGLPTGLRLYFPKKIDNLDIEKELQQVIISEKRLDKSGGLKGPPTSDMDTHNYAYKFYDINMHSKEFNIKMIYKVLAMLFKQIKSNKTVITITGKYGERGYSFTSDYYNKDNKYVLHLTDQYFVSHTSYNCADILQRSRIQGKYTDKPNLIFWTTSALVKTINCYVEFISKLENKIMSLPRGHEHIRNLCEIFLLHPEFIKTLGRPNQRKNLATCRIKYNRKNNAMFYSFPPNLKSNKYEDHFSNWCKTEKIEFNGFINRLKKTHKDNYIKYNHIFKIEIPKKMDKSLISPETIGNREYLKKIVIEKFPKFNKYTLDRIIRIKKDTLGDRYNGIEKAIENNNPYNFTRNSNKLRYNIIIYKNENYPNIHITSISDEKILGKSDLNILQKQNYIKLDNDKILYSRLNKKYINDTFLNQAFDESDILDPTREITFEKEDIQTINEKPYFFLTADGYVYHHDPGKKLIKNARIQIKS